MAPTGVWSPINYAFVCYLLVILIICFCHKEIPNTTTTGDIPVSSKNFNVQQIREFAITQSTKPSGSESSQAKHITPNVEDATQALTIKNTINNNMMGSGGHVVKQQQQQVTKRLVYTQYREMLKRYEQSSRL